MASMLMILSDDIINHDMLVINVDYANDTIDSEFRDVVFEDVVFDNNSSYLIL